MIVQEFADKGNLAEEIRKRQFKNPPQFWSERALLSFLFKCVEALAQAQELGIAHCDIKPENCLLFYDKDFKL